jgi:hypothetical protein
MPLPDLLLWIWANREEIGRVGTPIVGLIGGAVGIWLLYIRTRAADRTARAALEQARVAVAQAKTAADRHEEQTRADRERRITESFARAVEQLGSDKLETRLGAIYTLEHCPRKRARILADHGDIDGVRARARAVAAAAISRQSSSAVATER